MGPQEMPDELLQEKSAAMAQRLECYLSLEQQVARNGHIPPLCALEPAINALRGLAELLKKESESR